MEFSSQFLDFSPNDFTFSPLPTAKKNKNNTEYHFDINFFPPKK